MDILKEHQIGHFQRIMDILTKFPFYIDGSEMGLGKTYVAAAVARILRFPCIVFCPKTARAVWEEVLGKTGVSVYAINGGGIITYDTLRSRKGYQPKHGLLVRDDSGEGTIFSATPLFHAIVEAGVLVIFDEAQRVKNGASDQCRATCALTKAMFSKAGHSRFALLSGTLIDDDVHIINLVRMLGMVTCRNLYTKIRGRIRLDGIDELNQWAMKINKEEGEKFLSRNMFKPTRPGCIKYVFDIFTEVIRPAILSTMTEPESDSSLDIKNGFYPLAPEDEEEYVAAVTTLASRLNFNMTDQTIDRSDIFGLTPALRNMQKAKCQIMINRVKKRLNSPMYNEAGELLIPKYVLYADYYEVLDRLLTELDEFNPVELSGRVSEEDRTSNIAAFQEDNDRVRLLIGNPATAAISISLNDKTGKFPRFMDCMPNFRADQCHQATRRCKRVGTVGLVTVRFIYGNHPLGIKEKIMTTLYRKGEVMAKMHKEQTDYGVKFPNEYENEYEEIPQPSVACS